MRSATWLLAAALLVAGCGREPSPAQPTPEPDTTVAPPPEPTDEPLGEPADPVEPDPEQPEEPEEPVEAEPEEVEPEPSPAPEPKPRARPRPTVPVLPGAVLPRERIVAFYGNPASKRMGILGELPPDEMLARLDREAAKWRRADPAVPVRPALHMIAVMATGDPGRDSLFRLRMPDWRIEKVVEWAERRDALVFLDIQPGQSTVRKELPRLREWLARPHIHLALDPEWTMGPDERPGTRIGSMDAEAINYAIDFLAELVEEYDLPPKVLVVHRFTQGMIRNAEEIRLDPRVQVVINMDGWGPPSQKRYAYREIVAPEAYQFTGFKIFFRNDRRNDSRLMTPDEILQLDPVPVYIQYQ
jgi:hypothetical protein